MSDSSQEFDSNIRSQFFSSYAPEFLFNKLSDIFGGDSRKNGELYMSEKKTLKKRILFKDLVKLSEKVIPELDQMIQSLKNEHRAQLMIEVLQDQLNKFSSLSKEIGGIFRVYINLECLSTLENNGFSSVKKVKGKLSSEIIRKIKVGVVESLEFLALFYNTKAALSFTPSPSFSLNKIQKLVNQLIQPCFETKISNQLAQIFDELGILHPFERTSKLSGENAHQTIEGEEEEELKTPEMRKDIMEELSSELTEMKIQMPKVILSEEKPKSSVLQPHKQSLPKNNDKSPFIQKNKRMKLSIPKDDSNRVIKFSEENSCSLSQLPGADNESEYNTQSQFRSNKEDNVIPSLYEEFDNKENTNSNLESASIFSLKNLYPKNHTNQKFKRREIMRKRKQTIYNSSSLYNSRGLQKVVKVPRNLVKNENKKIPFEGKNYRFFKKHESPNQFHKIGHPLKSKIKRTSKHFYLKQSLQEKPKSRSSSFDPNLKKKNSKADLKETNLEVSKSNLNKTATKTFLYENKVNKSSFSPIQKLGKSPIYEILVLNTPTRDLVDSEESSVKSKHMTCQLNLKSIFENE